MAKNSWKGAPNGRRALAVKRAPSQPSVRTLPVPAASSTFKSTGDARRDSLLQQIETAQQALSRESASGFGSRSKNAAEHLDRLNKELAAYDASGFGARAIEISKTAVPALVGGVAGAKIASGMGTRNAARAAQNIDRFNALAKTVERLRKNTPSGIVGSKAGDKLVALVNEGFVLGGAKQPFRSVPTLATSIVRNARPLFAKAGGKFGAGLVVGLAAEGIASRYVLPNYTPDPVLRESLAITGTASLAAAVTYSVKRKIDMAKPGLRPASTEIAKVTAAHGQIVREIGGTPARRAGRAAALKAASRVILPAAVGAAAILAFSRSSRAGEGTSTAIVKGVSAGANEAGMGVPQAAEGYFRSRGQSGVSGFIASTVVRTVAAAGARVSGLRAAIARRGASRSVAPVRPPLARRGAAPVAISSGRVESYYRVQGGKSVFVHGYSRG
jgi:hypothetical protein